MTKKINFSLEIDQASNIKISRKLKNYDIDLNSYLNELVIKDLSPIVYLNNNFFYDREESQLYYESKNNEIYLSKLENRLFQLLLDNRGYIVEIEKIEKIVWNDKKMSRESLRNRIRSIRLKTYKEIIENHSNIGYIMM